VVDPCREAHLNFEARWWNFELLSASINLTSTQQNRDGSSAIPRGETQEPLHLTLYVTALSLLNTTKTIESKMASPEYDPLLLLRQAIAAGRPPIPTESDDSSAAETNLSTATHLAFSVPTKISIPITTPTRFISSEKPVDLRNVFFVFLHRESPIPVINESATKLNAELEAAGDATGRIQNIPFLERTDLVAWLDGSEESEYVRPLPGDRDAAAASAAATAGVKGSGPAPLAAARSGRGTLDPRLAVIYNGERKTGDRNTVLRGIKPTVGLFLLSANPGRKMLTYCRTSPRFASSPRPSSRRSHSTQEQQA
jgi:parafibromin